MGYENESTGVGFVPQRLTANVASLKLNLRNKLNERYKRIRLRFRAEYIPLPEAPNVGSMTNLGVRSMDKNRRSDHWSGETSNQDLGSIFELSLVRQSSSWIAADRNRVEQK
jgi:hypothetical protein